MQPDASSVCPNCGIAQAPLGGLGWMTTLQATDVLDLCFLLRGDFDDMKCLDCKKPMGVSATVTWFDDQADCLHTFLGSRMNTGSPTDWKPFEDVAARLSQDLGRSIQLHRCDSLETLRENLRANLRSLIAPPVHALASKDVNALREFTRSTDARTFSAIEVGRLLPSSGLALVARDENGPVGDAQAIYRDIALLQAESWIQFLGRWLRNEHTEPTFGDGLSHHLQPDAVLPGADAAALASIDERLAGKPLSERGRYLHEALRAAIHATVGTDNPKADTWALMHFTAGLQCRFGDDTARAVALALDVGPHWASSTVSFEAAWNALGELFRRLGPDELQAFDEMAKAAGHPDLMAQFTAEGVRTVDEAPSADRMVGMVKHILASMPGTANDPSRIGMTVELCGQTLRRDGALDAIEAAINILITDLPADDETLARLFAWYGRCCKEQREPKRFLKCVGDRAQPWEHALSAEAQARLWIERSNALRLAGRYAEALDEVCRVKPLMSQLDQKQNLVVQRNLAILLRETGDVEGSVAALEAQLATAVSGERIPLLESLSIGYHLLNRHTDAARCADDIVALSKGPFAAHAHRARAHKALSLVLGGHDGQAIDLLLELDGLKRFDAETLMPYASAWATLLQNNSETVPASALAGAALGRCVERLWTMVQQAEERGDVATVLDALRLSATLLEVVDDGEAERLWSLTLAACEHHKQAPGARELLALASWCYERGDLAQGRELLLRLPHSLTSTSAAVVDVGSVSASLARSLQHRLDRLSDAVSRHSSSFQDLRLVAEMRRDTVTRAQRLARGALSTAEFDALSQGLSDAVLAHLAPTHGRLAVVEWLETSDTIGCFVTVIDSGGGVASHWLHVCPVELGALAEKMGNRLRDWTPGRPGDPFDLSAWQQAEAWLLQALAQHMDDDAHVVFLENRYHAGLPWHAAVGSRWSASYASGWGALLSMERDPPIASERPGLALIPRWNESAEVLSAMQACADRMETLTAARGLALQRLLGAQGDAEALADLLGNVDTALLVCHGFVDESGQDVALMLAHQGHLPSAWSVAVSSETARAHRFNWRQCRALSNAPATLFSAACSSNRAHVVGLGDRIGLFAALRHAGTRRLVAPRWDVVATSFLPVVCDALERHLDHGTSLAGAVRQACLEAQNLIPRWLCWALCIEGDWR